MTNFIDVFVEQRGLDTTRKLIHRHGFRAVLATAFIREGSAEIVRVLRKEASVDPTRVADVATAELVLRRLDAAWIASRTGTEPHVARDALATLVPDFLLALRELHQSCGSLRSVLGETEARAEKTRPVFDFSWTLDLIAV